MHPVCARWHVNCIRQVPEPDLALTVVPLAQQVGKRHSFVRSALEFR